MEIELPWFSVALIATSDFFIEPAFTILGLPVYGAIIVLAVPILLFMTIKALRASSEDIAYKSEQDQAFEYRPSADKMLSGLEFENDSLAQWEIDNPEFANDDNLLFN